MTSKEFFPQEYGPNLANFVDQLFVSGRWKDHTDEMNSRSLRESSQLEGSLRSYARAAENYLRLKKNHSQDLSSEYSLPETTQLSVKDKVKTLAILEDDIGYRVNRKLAQKKGFPSEVVMHKDSDSNTFIVPVTDTSPFSFVQFSIFTDAYVIKENPELITDKELVVGLRGNIADQMSSEMVYYHTFGVSNPTPLTDRLVFYFGKTGASHLLFQPAPTVEEIRMGTMYDASSPITLQETGIHIARHGLALLSDIVTH